MAPELKQGSKRYPLALGASILIVAALAALVFALRSATERSGEDLETAKKNYVRMQEMARTIREHRRKNPNPFRAEKEEGDVIGFLSAKAREAGIPEGVLSISPSSSVKVGAWQEAPYVVSLRSPSKDAPLARSSLVTFLRLVEEQRSLLRSKNANLSFSGDDLKSVVIGFSQFTLDAQESGDRP